jgi:predicted ArsR family transcriptional regulator
MNPTRQQILDHLERRRQATAAELSRALRVTAANIRHHLAILEQDGWVEVAGKRPPKGKGRPTRVYALSPRRQEDNLSGLLCALLKQIPSEERPAAFASLAETLSAHTPPLPAEHHLTRHLIQTVKCLNAMHYRARWEAHAAAPRIRINHCPYAAIVEECPEVCQLDAYLLEHLLHRGVRQIARRKESSSGGPYCLFAIEP